MISSALSSKEDAKYLVSEDGKQRIYGNGDVSSVVVAPGTWSQWTDEDGNADSRWHTEPYVFQAQEGWIWTTSEGDLGGFRPTQEECEALTSFVSLITDKTWTRTYTPGAESWTKEGELALKSDISSSPYVASREYVDSSFLPLNGGKPMTGKLQVGSTLSGGILIEASGQEAGLKHS